MTNPPPVAPVEGHYALLRNGVVARPVLDDWPENPPYFDPYVKIYWYRDGTAQPETKSDLDVSLAPLCDIIATISPADMQAVASGRIAEFERLKEALELAVAANAKMKDALSFYADDGPTPNVDGPWKATSWDFGAFARCTLADVANIEGEKPMTDPDVFFSHAESTIYELRKCLELIIIAHETGRYEPLQAAIEAAVIKVAELGMPSFGRTALQGDAP